MNRIAKLSLTVMVLGIVLNRIAGLSSRKIEVHSVVRSSWRNHRMRYLFLGLILLVGCADPAVIQENNENRIADLQEELFQTCIQHMDDPACNGVILHGKGITLSYQQSISDDLETDYSYKYLHGGFGPIASSDEGSRNREDQ